MFTAVLFEDACDGLPIFFHSPAPLSNAPKETAGAWCLIDSVLLSPRPCRLLRWRRISETPNLSPILLSLITNPSVDPVRWFTCWLAGHS